MGENVQQCDKFVGAPACNQNQAGMASGDDLFQQWSHPGIGERLVSILSKWGKSSVIPEQESRLVGLSYVAKEVLQVGIGKGVQQVLLLLFSQASSHQAAEAPNQVPGTGPANCLLPV